MDAWQVVAQPRRRQILRLLWDDELPAGAIAAHFDITFGGVSQHLAVLREAGYVAVRQAGTRRYYRVDKEGLGPMRPALERMWAHTLDDLAAAVEADAEGSDVTATDRREADRDG